MIWTILYRKGYYGRKSPYTIVYANHHSHLFNYHSRLSLKLSRQVHNLDFSFSSENLVNDMTAYRMNRNTQGASYYEYLNPVKSVNKAWNEVHIGYTGYYRIVRELPLWTVQTGLNFSQRKQTGYLYPYLRRQDLRTTEPYMSLSRNVIMRKGVFSLQAGYAYKRALEMLSRMKRWLNHQTNRRDFPSWKPSCIVNTSILRHHNMHSTWVLSMPSFFLQRV